MSLGGLNIYDMRTEIVIEQLKLIRDAIFSDSATGKLIMINIHSTRLEAGIDFGILEEPSRPISYITPTWITSVRGFLANHNLTITITDQPDVLLRAQTMPLSCNTHTSSGSRWLSNATLT